MFDHMYLKSCCFLSKHELTLQDTSENTETQTGQQRKLTVELQALHSDLVDVRRGTHVIFPDFGVDAQVSDMKDQERGFLLLSGLLQGQQNLEEETENRIGRIRQLQDGQQNTQTVNIINIINS